MDEMGLLVRALGACSVTLVGCAALVGLQDRPTEFLQSEDDASSPGPVGSSDASDARPVVPEPPKDSGTDAATLDATPPPPDASPGCTKKPNDATCDVSAECCGACAENLRCRSTCKSLGTCNPLAQDECCVGYYCSGFCLPCKPKGAMPDVLPVINQPNPRSCCAKTLDDDGACK